MKYSSDVADLGVIITSDLKFSTHCIKLATKASRRAALIFRCFQTKI
jgi:hypothetical protein